MADGGTRKNGLAAAAVIGVYLPLSLSRKLPAVALLCAVVAVPAPVLAQEGAATSFDRPFSRLFEQTADEFRRVVSTDSAAILAIGGLAAAIGHARDHTVSGAMSGSDALDSALAAGETVGGARMQAAGALATYALGRITGNATISRVGGDLIRAQIVTQTLTLAVKTAVRRTRPDGTQYSFPSGHSAATFASATVLQRNFGWEVGIPAYAVASYVAASRVQDRRHFLSDVTFGAALGIVAGRTVTIGRGDRRFALAPAAVRGGGAVTLTWVGRTAQ